jgi:hypothetical protein
LINMIFNMVRQYIGCWIIILMSWI